MLKPGTKVYRARKKPKPALSETEFDSPPQPRAARFNSNTLRTFYGAFDVETCLAELKLTPEEVAHNVVVLATFELNAPLTVLDLGHKEVQGNESIWNTLFFLTLPSESDYFMSQALGLHVASMGLAGFISPSATRFSIQNFSAQNLVLFGAPVNENRLRLTSLNRVNITGVHYDFQFGPVWEEPDAQPETTKNGKKS